MVDNSLPSLPLFEEHRQLNPKLILFPGKAQLYLYWIIPCVQVTRNSHWNALVLVELFRELGFENWSTLVLVEVFRELGFENWSTLLQVELFRELRYENLTAFIKIVMLKSFLNLTKTIVSNAFSKKITVI